MVWLSKYVEKKNEKGEDKRKLFFFSFMKVRREERKEEVTCGCAKQYMM